MLIGIYDLDLLLYDRWIPSIDLMKYSGYHKKKGDVVHTLYEYDGWEAYDIVYVRRDKYSQAVPSYLLSISNVEWVGRRFFDDVIIPLPWEIETCPADASIYRSYYTANEQKYPGNRKMLNRGIIFRGTNWRLVSDGKLVTPYPKNQPELFIYDKGPIDSKLVWPFFQDNIGAKIVFVERIEIEDFELIKFLQDNFQVKRRNDFIAFTGNLNDIDFENDCTRFRHQYQVQIPLPETEEDCLNIFIDYINKWFYAVSKGKVLYFILPIEKREKLKYWTLLSYLKAFSRNCGKTSDMTFYDVARRAFPAILNKFKSDEGWHQIEELLKPLLTQNISEVYAKGEWDYYDPRGN